MTLNNRTHGSEYNSEILEDSLKADNHFDFPKNARTILSDPTNASIKVDEYFSGDGEQFNCEMHQFNSAMKYGLGVLQNTWSTIAFDENGRQIKISNSKWKRLSEIVTPSGEFP